MHRKPTFSKKYLLWGISLSLFFFCSSILHAQTSISGKDCTGIWKTIDDEDGKVKSHVEVYEKDGRYFARVIKLLDPQILKDNNKERYEDVVCKECPDDRGKNKPLLGLQMLWDMEKLSDKYGKGEIMDPKTGKIYDCTLWLDEADAKGNTLKVRGWLLFFYRTQTWYRVE